MKLKIVLPCLFVPCDWSDRARKLFSLLIAGDANAGTGGEKNFLRTRTALQGAMVAAMLSWEVNAQAADRTWNGGGTASYWRTNANWGGTAPVANDRLFFGGTTRLINTNDLTANTTFTGVIFNSGAGAFVLSGNAITLNGGVTNNSSSTQTINNVITSAAAQTWNASAGNLVFGGNLDVQLPTTKGAGDITINGNLANFAGLTNNADGAVLITGTIAVQANPSVFTVADGAAADDVTVSGVISGSSLKKVTKEGAGTLVLSGANTFTGDTIINGGVVRIEHNTAWGDAGNSTSDIAAGAALQLQGGISVANGLTINGSGIASDGVLRSLSGNNRLTGTIALGSASSFGCDSGTLTLNGVVSGSFRLTKVGSGTLTLSNNNTYTGGTTVSAGTLALGTSNVLANAGALTMNGGTFSNAGYSDAMGALTNLSSSTIALGTGTTGTLTFASGTYVAGTLTILNWTGTAGVSGTANRIFITAAPSAPFLANINFTGYQPGAIRLGTGEIVPSGPAPTKLAITSVNGGSSPTAGTAFSVVVQAQEAVGTPRNVTANTAVTLSLNTGSGTLGGTLTGTILAGTSSVTISGVTYIKAEGGVSLTATRTSGDTLTAGNSAAFTVIPGVFTKLQLLMPGETASPGSASGKTGSPSAQTAGSAFTVTVNSVDANWNVASSTHTVGITSSDANAGLPANNALVAGTKTFNVTLKTAGSRTVTATDITDGTRTANTSPATTVSAGSFTKLQLLMPGETASPGSATGKIGTPTAQTAGAAFNVTVNSVDANWNVVSSTDIVGITSSDANAGLPANAALVAGTKTFSVTLKTVGSWTVTATDISNGAKTANTSPATTVNAGAFTKLQLLMPGETASPGSASGKTATPTAQTAGTAFTVTVNSVDANWNPISTNDTVGITSSDVNAALPVNAALVAGTKTFSVTLKTVGSWTVTATDITTPAKTPNTSPATAVNPGAFTKLQLLMPGETASPGSTSGKTGTPTAQTVGTALTVTVNAVDGNWNLINTNDTAAITSTDGGASLPANAALVVGTRTFNMTLNTAGSATVTASNVTVAGITANTSPLTTVNKGNQIITFPSPGNQTYGVSPITLGATASSGLALTYGITSGPATVLSNTLTITGVGSVTIQASQSGSANWNAATPVSQVITVAQKTLTGGITANNKTYDRTPTATIVNRTLTGVVGADVVTLANGTATFADKNVGNAKIVTATGLSLTGANAANYVLASTSATTTANITALALTVTGVTASNKVYNGNTTATVSTNSAALVGVVGGDTVALSGTTAGTFANSAVATGKTVTVSGLTLNGTDAGNYTLTQPTTTADITTASTLNAVTSSLNPAPTGSNVTFTATLSVVSPGGGTPTGNVIFKDGTTVLGTNALNGSAVAIFSTSALLHGTHTITAGYAGDGNFFGSTNSLSPDLAINALPVAPAYTITRTGGLSMVKVSVAQLLANGSDADGDTLSISSVTNKSAQGAEVELFGSYVFYTPTNAINVNDSYTYTLSDGQGGIAIGTVSVNLATAAQSRQLTSVTVGSGSFYGVLNTAYTVQYVDDMSSTNWLTLTNVTTSVSGLGAFADPGPLPPQRFYRIVYP